MTKERFFGLHFDFHATNRDRIGYRTRPEEIEWYIREAQPDFVQCDCKGHPGNSSYPTKVGKQADRLQTDNLKIWCDTVHKHDLPVYLHYSGVWDAAYTKAHPEEAAVDEKGERTEQVSLFGNYVTELLIPQIKELVMEYQIDGIWVDGDCWAVHRDFSALAKPYLSDNITKEEHNQIMRRAFLAYVKRYVEELHEFAPQLRIASNWAYSSYIPEKPEIDVDYISGDYPQNNSVHAARYEGRCIDAQDKPWDLMAWSFNSGTDKSAAQLMQEAAMVLMLGGGFQMYITQNGDGSARKYQGDKLRRIGEFVRARRFIFQKDTFAQVGILYSAESFYKKSNIFNAAGATKPLIGALNCILDGQYTADIILEHQMDRLGEHDIILIPEWEYISEERKKTLLYYVREGGSLVVIGANSCVQFGDLTGKRFWVEKEPFFHEARNRDNFVWIMDEDGNFGQASARLLANLGEGEEPLYFNHDMRDVAEHLPAYRIDCYGQGKIAYIPFGLGTNYCERQSYIWVNFFRRILTKLKMPMIEINRRHIDLSFQKEGDGILVNLANMQQGRHSLDVLVYDEIPPQYDVEITIRKPFSRVTMPLGEEFTSEYGEDFVKVSLKKLDIHSVIRCE